MQQKLKFSSSAAVHKTILYFFFSFIYFPALSEQLKCLLSLGALAKASQPESRTEHKAKRRQKKEAFSLAALLSFSHTTQMKTNTSEKSVWASRHN